MLELLRSALALQMSYLGWEGIYLLRFLLGPSDFVMNFLF